MKSIHNGKQPEENFFVQATARYLPYWPLFVALLVIAAAAAWTYLHFTIPIYESNARILIKDEKKGTEDSKAVEGLNLLSTKKIIENETEVIQSRTLIREVVNNLHLYITVMENRPMVARPAYTSSPVSIEARYDANIEYPKKIPFAPDPASRKITMNGRSYPLNQWTATPYGQLRFVPNPHYKGKASAYPLYFQITDPKSVISSIQKRLKVTTSNKQSSILTISLRDEVPERSEDILNKLMQAYNNAMVTEKNTLAANTLASVDARLKSVEHDLDSIERRSERYKSEKGVVNISEQGRLFLENMSANDQRMGDASTQLAVLNQVENYVRSKNNEGSIVPSIAGISDPVLPKLIDKLYTLELERASARKVMGEKFPDVVALTDQVDKIKPAILENIQSQRRSLEASTNNIAAANRSYASVLQTMPQKERELIEINRQQNIKSNIYSFLLQKREETALTHASTMSDSRIIDQAESDIAPVAPKRKVIYLSALLIALVIGVAFIALREAFSRKIMFREEIYQYSAVPVIGEISSSSNKKPVVIAHQEKSMIAAQFRKLRSSLSYIGISGQKKRLLVTSAISGEGKSFVALNLAISLALTGKKVVLVDADLNNPSLATKLQISKDKGLTEYLTTTIDEDDIIRPAGIHEHLSFVSSGSMAPNPAELLLKPRMEELLNLLDARFDYVVVDTAPVGLVPDAYALAPFCDATIFVVRHGYTPKALVQQLDENNKINHLRNIGIVFNDVHTRGFSSKYGYGYGHNYTDNNYYRLSGAGI